MASKELDQAIAVQQGMLQEFVAVQTPDEYRAMYSRIMRQYQPAADVIIEAVTVNGVPSERMTPPNVVGAPKPMVVLQAIIVGLSEWRAASMA